LFRCNVGFQCPDTKDPRSLQKWVGEITSNLNTLLFLYVIPFLQFKKEPWWLIRLGRISFYNILFLMGVALVVFYSIATYCYWAGLSNNTFELGIIKYISASLTILALIPFGFAFHQIFKERVPDFEYVFLFVLFVLLVVCVNNLREFITVPQMIHMISFLYRLLMLVVFLVLAASYYEKEGLDINKVLQDLSLKSIHNLIDEDKIDRLLTLIKSNLSYLYDQEIIGAFAGVYYYDHKKDKTMFCHFSAAGNKQVVSDFNQFDRQIFIYNGLKDDKHLIGNLNLNKTKAAQPICWGLKNPDGKALGGIYMDVKNGSLTEKQSALVMAVQSLQSEFPWAGKSKIWPEILAFIERILSMKTEKKDDFHDSFDESGELRDPKAAKWLYSPLAAVLDCSIEKMDASFLLRISKGVYHAGHPLNRIFKGVTDNNFSCGIIWLMAMVAEARQRKRILDDKNALETGYFIKKWGEFIPNWSKDKYGGTQLESFFRGSNTNCSLDEYKETLERIYKLFDLLVIKERKNNVSSPPANNVLSIDPQIDKSSISFTFGLNDAALFKDKLEKNIERWKNKQDLIGNATKAIVQIKYGFRNDDPTMFTWSVDMEASQLTLTFNFRHVNY
jgi:hypothetical protein